MIRDRSASSTEAGARTAIVAACRRMNSLGINQGKAGNVSLRWNRGAADGLLVTPGALAYDEMGADDIAWLSLAADAGAGGETVPTRVDAIRAPSSEWRMHRDVYALRGDAAAVVHCHAPYASALACSARIQRDGIPAFHYMVAVAGGADIRCARYATFGSQALSDHVLAALDSRSACLMANHGLLALGGSLEQALALALEVETLCAMYSRVLALGDPVLLDAQEMARVIARFGRYR